LLSQSALTISEVADRLGYRDVFFFSRQFKQHNGLSPRQFRARERGR
jgi:AraC-like DNA-binding protein